MNFFLLDKFFFFFIYAQFITGFLATLPAPPGSPFHEMLALDCEMVSSSIPVWFKANAVFITEK